MLIAVPWAIIWFMSLSEHTVIAQYRAHGDHIPSSRHLEQAIPIVQSTDSWTLQSVCADLCIDMAQRNPEETGKWLRIAEDELDTLLERVTESYHFADHSRLERAAATITSAGLRRQELDLWEEAITETEISIDYLSILYQAAEIAKICAVAGNGSQSVMVEYIPILMGAREMDRHREGWIGRLSLLREDGRPIGGNSRKQKYNPNWDCGVSFTSLSGSFRSPEHRIQMKMNQRFRAEQYLNAGLVVMAAKHYGFENPLQMIASFLAEEGDESYIDLPDDVHTLTPMQLDDIAGLFETGIETKGTIK